MYKWWRFRDRLVATSVCISCVVRMLFFLFMLVLLVILFSLCLFHILLLLYWSTARVEGWVDHSNSSVVILSPCYHDSGSAYATVYVCVCLRVLLIIIVMQANKINYNYNKCILPECINWSGCLFSTRVTTDDRHFVLDGGPDLPTRMATFPGSESLRP